MKPIFGMKVVSEPSEMEWRVCRVAGQIVAASPAKPAIVIEGDFFRVIEPIDPEKATEERE